MGQLVTYRGAGAGGLPPVIISQSVQLDDTAGQYFRTPGNLSHSGSQRHFTYSVWVRFARRNLTGNSYRMLTTLGPGVNGNQGLRFRPGTSPTGNTPENYWYSTAFDQVANQNRYVIRSIPHIFPDLSAWYHFYHAYDSTLGTSTDRLQVWVNGERVPQTAQSGFGFPPSNFNAFFCQSYPHIISADHNNTAMGYWRMAQAVFISGEVQPISNFGEFDTNGHWQPKDVSGLTFPNGGSYYLDFSDAGNLGADRSGNGNNFTVYGSPSVSADVPQNTCAIWSGQVPNGYTRNTGSFNYQKNPTHGGVGLTHSGTTKYCGLASHAFATRKNYMIEITRVTAGTNCYTGFTDPHMANDGGALPRAYVDMTGYVYVDAVNQGRPFNQGNGETIAIGIDVASKEFVVVAPDNAVYRYAWPTMPETLTFYYHDDPSGFSSAREHWWNFGQAPTIRTWPAGFEFPTTRNMPPPPVANSKGYFEGRARSGTGATQNITLVQGPVGSTWTKRLNASGDHLIYTDQYASHNPRHRVIPNRDIPAGAEGTSEIRVENDGRTINGNADNVNNSGNNYLDLHIRQLLAAGAAIFTYVGDSVVGRAIPHGLGVSPARGIVMVKNLSVTADWHIGHGYLAYDHADINEHWRYVVAHNTNGRWVSTSTFNGTAPDATNVYVGNGLSINASGNNYLMIVCAPTDGAFATGWFNGNGNAEGPVLPMTLAPELLYVKCASHGENHVMVPGALNPRNPMTRAVRRNTADAEHSLSGVYGLAGAARLRTSGEALNTSNRDYIWWAWPRAPFHYGRGR